MITLRDIAGHDQSLLVLQRSIAEGRLHHSLIFHGPEAVGKRTAALALAAALNCESPAAGDACGSCTPCQKIGKGIHPDVVTLTLERTVIPIDAIRRLRQEAAYRPYEGRRRVFVVDPADRMSVDAQNALLKTLEEPPAGSCIVLVTARPMHLLPTTRSRCQNLAFGTMPARVLADRLARARGITPEEALRAARLSGGRYGAALSLDMEAHDAARAEAMETLDLLARPGPAARAIKRAEAFGTEAGEIALRLDQLAVLVRDLLLMHSGAPDEALVNADVADALAALSGAMAADADVLETMIDRIRIAANDLERNVNRRLLVETLLLDLSATRHGRANRLP